MNETLGFHMKLWLVEDYDRWGYSLNVVRAESAEEAVRLVHPGKHRKPFGRIEVIPLPLEGEPAIIWCRDESPDTPRD